MSLAGVPRHVAIIMDGNGRWANERLRPRMWGHVRGCHKVKPIVKEAERLGIKVLTLFAFSTENWSRPEDEVGTLWKLLKKFLTREIDELDRMNVRLRVIGEVNRLAQDVYDVVDRSISRLSKNTGLELVFAVSYGGRRELARAARLLAEEVRAGRLEPEQITEQRMEQCLWTAPLGELSNVDLVIRTSGELRSSNFLPWQAAYAEYYFTDVLWPDFDAQELQNAVKNFLGRQRRFGGAPGLTLAGSSGENSSKLTQLKVLK